MISFSFKDRIETDFNGHRALLAFYLFACKYNNTTIQLDMNELAWIDANQSALLLAIIHKLKQENKLKFYFDYHAFNTGLEVLKRNGFAYAVTKLDGFNTEDYRDSTIPLKAFKIDNADGFVNYIENVLLAHRGLAKLVSSKKDKIKNSYFEVFDNVGIHANIGFALCCGQLFPEAHVLKFTLVDLGDGFLKKIAAYTKSNENIVKASDAINWAVKGGSTKIDTLGGTGLKGIMNYCMFNGGELHIASDDCYWQFADKSILQYKLDQPFVGATIHLIFRFI